MTHQPTFARFWRCALQVNPYSYNNTYRGGNHGLSEADYNQALLAKCLEHDIKVVGLADHGNVESVDKLRTVLTDGGIVVFPGFEIASSDKTHFVCLFAENTSSDQLNRYLGNLELLDPDDGVRPSRLSSDQLIDKVVQLNGFIYAAHCTSSSGLLKNKQNHVWQKPNLRAVQIPGSMAELPDEEAFYRQVLLNQNPDYRRERPMAVINAKDIAQPDDLALPGATCLVKMTNPTFDAFKVAFLDPESRIRLNSQQLEKTAGEIVSMAITGGYLDGVEIFFSSHLNAVIGGRGTGKSTLLECLRYVLDILPKSTQAQKVHREIIKENLGNASGRVEIKLISSLQNGKRYKVSRRFGEAPIVRDENNDVSNLQARDLLPGIDIYGQNEIYELAQDAQSRIQLLDRFLPEDGDYAQRDANFKMRLQANQQTLLKTLRGVGDLKEQLARLPKLVEQLKNFEAMGIKEKLAKTPLFAREHQIVDRIREEIRHLRTGIESLQENMPDLTFISDKALEQLPNASLLSPARRILEALGSNFERHLAELKAELSNGEQQLKEQLDAWKVSIVQGETELEQALRSLPATAGKSGQEVGTAYQRLLQDIERIRPLQARVNTHDALCATQQQERRNLLAELSDLRAQRLENLQRAAKKLNRRLDGKLKVTVVADADRTPLKSFLLESQLEGIGEKRLKWIDEKDAISPLALVQAIRLGASELQNQWELTSGVAEALVKLPESRLMELEALELAHRIDILLNVAHGSAPANFRPLDKLSTGQQCTAILHMLLLENVDPLIMDQPEDNLDNAFIAERIVQELRAAKTSRQFLFATHNANIPVFGDAEWIGVFTVDESNHGSLAFAAQGSIDVPVIRDQVATILEGGKDAFIQRKEKYAF